MVGTDSRRAGGVTESKTRYATPPCAGDQQTHATDKCFGIEKVRAQTLVRVENGHRTTVCDWGRRRVIV